MLYLLALTYATVLTAELVGDKLLYTISILTTRYRVFPVLSGVALAFMGKTTAAVLLGRFIAQLPTRIVTLVSAATFFTMALALSLKQPEQGPAEPEKSRMWSRTVVVSFAAIFFSEWGDPGQIAAAAVTARYQAPLAVWLGANLAMATKAIVAVTVGKGVLNVVPPTVLRYCGPCLLFSLGVLSLFNVH